MADEEPQTVGKILSLQGFRKRIMRRFPNRTWEEVCTSGEARIEHARQWDRIEGLRNGYRRYSGIEDWNMTLENYKPRTVSERTALKAVGERVQSWSGGRDSSLVLWGPQHGPGKTHLAVAYLIALLGRTIPVEVRWWRAADFIHQCEIERFSDEWGALDAAREVPMLALDDIDKINLAGNRGDFVSETILRLLDRRDMRKLPTVVTTQLTREQFEEVFGGAACDRLPARWWVEVSGPSGRAGGEE